MKIEEERKFARTLMGKLPRRVRIGPFDFALVPWSHHEATGVQRYGECSSVEQVIRLQQDMPTRYKAVDTVLHEIGHAIFWAYDIKDEDKEERIVSAMGTAWSAVYRDNAWLLDWIKSAKL